MIPAAGTVLSEVKGIKKRLDSDFVKALFSLCLTICRRNEAVQQLEAGPHILNVGPVLLRRILRKFPAVKAQLGSGDIMRGGAGSQGAHEGDHQNDGGEDGHDDPAHCLPGVFIG